METLVPHYEVISFDSRFGECEWITQNDELGFALDPHPCAGACSHLHVVLYSSLQPPDYHWTDGCIHRLIDMKAGFVGQTPDLTKTDTPDRIHCKLVEYITKIFSLRFNGTSDAELDPTLYSWMIPFCWSEGGGSHDTLMDVLLWLPTVNTVTCCGGAPGADGSRVEKRLKKQRKYIRKKRIKWFSILFFNRKVNVKEGFVSPTTSIHIHTASHTKRYFLSQCGRWLPEHVISVSYHNGRIFFFFCITGMHWNLNKMHHSSIILSLILYYLTGIVSYTHQSFEVQIVLYSLHKWQPFQAHQQV